MEPEVKALLVRSAMIIERLLYPPQLLYGAGLDDWNEAIDKQRDDRAEADKLLRGIAAWLDGLAAPETKS